MSLSNISDQRATDLLYPNNLKNWFSDFFKASRIPHEPQHENERILSGHNIVNFCQEHKKKIISGIIVISTLGISVVVIRKLCNSEGESVPHGGDGGKTLQTSGWKSVECRRVNEATDHEGIAPARDDDLVKLENHAHSTHAKNFRPIMKCVL